MKHMIPKVYLKQTLPLSILLIIAGIIWFAGAHFSWLEQPERRFYIISLFFIAWFIKFMFFDTEHTTSNTQAMPATTMAPELQKKVQTLNQRFAGAIEFLKKTSINKHGQNTNLSELPWFLLIGTSASGKTTLLAQSTINFILSKQSKQVAPSSSCDWWATRDLVLVDVPGTYISAKEKQAVDTTLWDNLIQLIKKNRGTQPINGVVITLHLPEIIKKHNSQQKKQILGEIKQRILNLRSEFGQQLPFYLVITKCDLLPGFNEYFSDCSTDELNQAWGVTLPPNKENEKLHDVFSHRFNALIKRLNKQLISRLHQERNPNARPYIKDFPLQIERLKEGIAHFLKALMIPDLRLQGVYLTSAAQPLQEETNTPTLINPAASQALQLAKQPSMPTRAYFIRQVISQGLLGSTEHTQQPLSQKEVWHRRFAYAASIAAVFICAILLGRDFQKSIHQTYALQNDLAKYQLYIQQADPQENHLNDALPLLDSLRKAANHSNYSLSHFVNVLSFYSHKSQKTADAVYVQALQTIVLPEIKIYLENYLQTSNKNPTQLYMALKTYLMLGNPDDFQTDEVISSLKQLMPDTFTEESLAKLSEHLSTLLTTSWQPIDINPELVAQTRQELSHLPPTELAFILLKNIGTNNQNSDLALGTNVGHSPSFISKQVTDKIPSMFTANAIQSVLSDGITRAATEALQGNFVLGTTTNTVNPASITALAEQLRNQYLANYVDIWESLLANIHITTPTHLSGMDTLIADLCSNSSPLSQLLKTIQQNTAFAPILSASPKIEALNILLASENENTLNAIFANLHQIDFYLQNILSNTDTGNAIFEATKNHLTNPASDPINQLHTLAEQSPEPVRTWLNHIATQTMKLMVQETGQYINTRWQHDISSTYRTQFSNHYPFDQNASQEVSLSQFTTFMGQPGTLNHFYQTYLKPFINETDKKWQWKMIDNQRLPFAESTLETLQHAFQIQHAFFPNGDNKLYVPFTLEAVNLDAHTKSFNLNINGQPVKYQKEKAPRLLSWPGLPNLHSTTMNFTGMNEQPASHVLKGDWAWFRLVTQSTKQIVSGKQLLLDFSLNGHNAKYMLFTQGHLNPFLPLNLSRFELPVTLG